MLLNSELVYAHLFTCVGYGDSNAVTLGPCRVCGYTVSPLLCDDEDLHYTISKGCGEKTRTRRKLHEMPPEKTSVCGFYDQHCCGLVNAGISLVVNLCNHVRFKNP